MTTQRVSEATTLMRGPMVGGWPLAGNVREAVDVVAVTNQNVATLAPGSVVDGVTFVGGERVLLTQQTTATENGIYVIQLAAPAYRAKDWSREVPVPNGVLVAVTRGTAYAGTVWVAYASSTGLLPTIVPDLHSPTIWPVGLDYTTERYSLPSGAVAQTMPRTANQSGQNALVSGTLQLFAAGINAGRTVSSVTFVSGGTGLTAGVSPHLWACLCDSSGVVKAVTADDTSPTWSANAAKTFTFGTPYTIPVGGLYYLGIMFAYSSGGTVPTLSGITETLTVVNGLTPPLAVTSTSSMTTPPALASTQTIGAVKSVIAYAYAS